MQREAPLDIAKNLAVATRDVEAAIDAGATLVMLPENFGLLGENAALLAAAQSLEEHFFLKPFIVLARSRHVYILAGSIPERGPDAQHVYNTSVLIGPQGNFKAVYRKIHLFDATLGGESRCWSNRRT